MEARVTAIACRIFNVKKECATERPNAMRRPLYILSIVLPCLRFLSFSKKDSSQYPPLNTADIVIDSGNFQAARPGESLNDPVVIQIVDTDQNPQTDLETLIEDFFK